MILHQNTISLLKKKYLAARAYQRKQNIEFNLTFEHYMTLWIKNVDALTHLNNAVIHAFTHGINQTIKLDYVLTWKPGFVRTGAPMNLKTAWVRSAEDSKKDCKLRKGEKKSERAKAKLRKPKSNTTNMRKPKSQEHKARMAEAARKRWAERREGK